jgi:hypothetical protein
VGRSGRCGCSPRIARRTRRGRAGRPVYHLVRPRSRRGRHGPAKAAVGSARAAPRRSPGSGDSAGRAPSRGGPPGRRDRVALGLTAAFAGPWRPLRKLGRWRSFEAREVVGGPVERPLLRCIGGPSRSIALHRDHRVLHEATRDADHVGRLVPWCSLPEVPHPLDGPTFREGKWAFRFPKCHTGRHGPVLREGSTSRSPPPFAGSTTSGSQPPPSEAGTPTVRQLRPVPDELTRWAAR